MRRTRRAPSTGSPRGRPPEPTTPPPARTDTELPTPYASDSAGVVDGEHQWQLAEAHARAAGTHRHGRSAAFHIHVRVPPAEKGGSRDTRPSRSRDRINLSSEATLIVWSASPSPVRR